MSVSSSSVEARLDRARLGQLALIVTVVMLVGICLPVLIRGAPLADDFYNCFRSQRVGLARALVESLERLGALRRAHFAEILLTTGTCRHLPFGVAISVPLVLTLVVAALFRRLLRELGVGEPWSSIGAAAWLLQPLGTEAALWPAALHIPLGLAFSLLALILYRGERNVAGTLAMVGAALSIEQVVIAMPIAVWMITPSASRRRAAASTAAVTGLVVMAFFIAPGDDPRVEATLGERLVEAVGDPAFLVQYPGVGVGLHSIPVAVWWALPLSILTLAGGALVGVRFARALSDALPLRTEDRVPAIRTTVLGSFALIAALNLPVVLSVPHQGSPRLFAPSWLALVGALALLGPHAPRKRFSLTFALGGFYAAGAVLSLVLSVWVRVETASFNEFAAHQIASRTVDDARVAVCGIERTAVEPAPRGAFALHEFMDEGTARDSLEYYTGRRATFLIAGEPWPERTCPREEVDAVFAFPTLIEDWRSVR